MTATFSFSPDELAEKIDAELTQILRQGWHKFKPEKKTSILADLAADRMELSDHARICGLLLDLLDPSGKALIDPKPDDPGLIGRWMFGEPQAFELKNPTSGLQKVFKPSSTSTKARYIEIGLAVYGQGTNFMRNRNGQRTGPGAELRARLVAQLVEMADGRGLTSETTASLAGDWAERAVPRHQEERCHELIRAGLRQPLVFHGPPGTGKTTLAARIATASASSVLVIRWARPTALDQGVYHFDLVAALAQLGVSGRSWTAAALEHALREALGEGRGDTVLLVDDMPAEVLRRLLPSTLRLPVLLTAAQAVPGWHDIEVDPYTPDEALAAARQSIPSASEPTLELLANQLGHLPLAIHQAACLLEAGHVSADELNTYLSADPVASAEILSDVDPRDRGLLAVCREALAAADRDPAAASVLLRLVWLIDDPFPSHDAVDYLRDGTDLSRPGCLAALSQLERLGVASRSGDFLVMHRLTRTLLRGLTAPRMSAALEEFQRRCLTAESTKSQEFLQAASVFGAVSEFVDTYFPKLPYRLIWTGPSNFVLISHPDGEAIRSSRGKVVYRLLQLFDYNDVAFWAWSEAGRSQVSIRDTTAILCLIAITEHVLALGSFGLGRLRPGPDMEIGNLSDITAITSPDSSPWHYPGPPDGTVGHEPIHPSYPDATGVVLTACGVACEYPPTATEAIPPKCRLCCDGQRRAAVAQELKRFGGICRTLLDDYGGGFATPDELPDDWFKLLCASGWAHSELGEYDEALENYEVAKMMAGQPNIRSTNLAPTSWIDEAIARVEKASAAVQPSE